MLFTSHVEVAGTNEKTGIGEILFHGEISGIISASEQSLNNGVCVCFSQQESSLLEHRFAAYGCGV
jgi:hypothetical protein